MLAFFLVLVPWLGLVLFLLPRTWVKPTAVGIGLVEVALFARALLAPMSAATRTVNWNWIPSIGVHFHLSLDGLSLFLVGLATVVTAAAMLASSSRQGPAYYLWILIAESAAIGVFTALDLVTFYVFWEVVLVPVFFLLGGWAVGPARATAMKWLIMNLFGSLFMLIGVIAVGVVHAQESGHLTFQLSALAHTVLVPAVAPWVFLAFLVSFVIKAPLWPLHGWMPPAYSDAPAPVTAVISGVLSKLGVFAMVRVLVPLFHLEMSQAEPWLMALAAVGLVYGAELALRQKDIKMVAAYGSLSHMAMMALGIFTLTQAGLVGATFYMVAHGVMLGGVFLLLGWYEDRVESRALSTLGGLTHAMPRLSAWFQIFALATLGLPGLAGFAGEFMIFQGLIQSNVTVAALAGLVLVVAAWYMLRLFQGAMQGPRVAPERARDLSAPQVGLIGALGLMVLVLGIWPAGVTSHLPRFVGPTAHTVSHVVRRKGGAPV
jgi:NADH-quinone oxidoreductase subunit M